MASAPARGQHVAVARQHAGRKSGDQHGVQFPIHTFRGSRGSHRGSPAWHTRCRPMSTQGGPRRCRPTNRRRATAKRKLERQSGAEGSRRRRPLIDHASAVAMNRRAQGRRCGDRRLPATAIGSRPVWSRFLRTTKTDPRAPARRYAGQLAAFAARRRADDCRIGRRSRQATASSRIVKDLVLEALATDSPDWRSARRMSMSTIGGNIGIQLDNAKSPCTVNSFARLGPVQCCCPTTRCCPGIWRRCRRYCKCGDPTGGRGQRRPGLQVRQRVPTRSANPTMLRVQKRWWIRAARRIANAGPGRYGSQFFLVYKDSKLPPMTVFGKIDDTGLLGRWTRSPRAGVEGGGQDGAATSAQGQIVSCGLDRMAMTDRPAADADVGKPTPPVRHPFAAYVRERARDSANGLAIASLMCAFVFAPLGIIFGHISLLADQQAPARKGTGWRSPGWSSATVTIIGATLAVVAVIGAVVATFMLTRDLESRRPTPRRPPRPQPTTPAPPARPARVRRARRSGRQLPVSGVHGAGEQAGQPAAHRPGARPTPAQVSASMATNRAISGCSSTTARRPAPSTTSPAWPSRATSTTPRAIG